MKQWAGLCIVALLARIAGGQDIAPAVFIHQPSGAQVYVACYWAQQFPRFATVEKHLLIACPVDTWHAADPTKRQIVLTAIRRFLAAEDAVSVERLAAIRDALADANVRIVVHDNPAQLLADYGLVRQ